MEAAPTTRLAHISARLMHELRSQRLDVNFPGAERLHSVNDEGHCDLPALDGDLTYKQIAAGSYHTVLLRSEGAAVACGGNIDTQCDLPALDGDLTYTQIAAGSYHTVLLRSEGTAVACGENYEGQCDLPALDGHLTFVKNQGCMAPISAEVLQVSYDGEWIFFLSLSG